MKKSYQKTVYDTLVNAGSEFILLPLLFIRMPILTKNLTTAEYGIWGLIFTTCSMSLTITSLGLGSAMSRFLPSAKSSNQIREGFYSVLLLKLFISTVLAFIFLIFSQFISSNFFDNNYELVKITSLLIIITTIQPVYFRLLKIIRKIKILSFCKILEGYGAVFLYSLLLFKGYGLISILYAYIILKLSIVLILIYNINSRYKFKWPSFSEIKSYFKYGLPTIPSSASFWIVNLSDRYIITFLLGSTSLGVYSAAYTIGSIPYMLSNLINFIMLVSLSKLYDDGEIDKVKTQLSYAAKYFFAIIIPFIFGSIICSKEILQILTTDEISMRGWYIIPIISSSYLFLGVYSLLNFTLLLNKKTKVLAYAWIIAMPINIILNLVIIPYFELLGAALTTALSYFIAMCITAHFSLKELTFPVDIKFIFKSIFSSLVMVLFLIFYSPVGLPKIMFSILFALIIYFTILIALKGFNKKEYILAKSVIQRFVLIKK